jgi:hypothetical protein
MDILVPNIVEVGIVVALRTLEQEQIVVEVGTGTIASVCDVAHPSPWRYSPGRVGTARLSRTAVTKP